MIGFVLEFQGITNFNFPKFIFLIKSSPVGYPSSAVGFSTAPLGPGWISFQSCDSLTIWRNKLAKPKPQDWDVQPLYFFFFERKFQLHVWQAKKRWNSTTMNQQETSSEWLARKQAGLGRLQGQHRVPGTSTNSLDRGWDKAAKSMVKIYQRVIRWLSVVYQRVISGLSVGYQRIIRGLLEGYQWVIRGLSVGFQ